MPDRLFRVLCVLMALAAFGMACCAAAMGEGAQVYAYTYTLKIYEKPSKKSEVVALVPFARPLQMIAEKKGWAQVITDDNHTGYCNARQLTEKNPNTYDVTVYAQQNRAPVYRCPSVDAAMIGHMDRNDRAKMLAMTPNGDWLRIQAGSMDGYIQRPRVDYKKYSGGKAGWVSVDSTYVYYDPALDTTICEINQGQQVAVVSVDGGWAKIRSGSGLIGYCRAEALSAKKPAQ